MERLKRIWAFIKTRVFWYNFLGAIGLFVLIIFLGNAILSRYTHHGESLTVPDLSGLTLYDAKEKLSDAGLDFEVIDSNYVLKKKPLTVLEQQPKANAKVKTGRTIFLTINCKIAPKIKMPDLSNTSFKQAVQVLDEFGLRLGQKIYKPDLAKNTVLEQQIAGRKILPGAEIPKGSTIDLILGDGLGNSEMEVPNLVGMNLHEAINVLELSDLNLGSVVADNTVSDSLSAMIYKQSPDFFDSDNKIHLGDGVDVFITTDQAKVDKAVHDQTQPHSTHHGHH